jgi:UDPglucose 6-dehydrogenase
MKIVVVGLGYVGLSNAVLLAQHNEVIGVDISQQRVEELNAKRSPLNDKELSQFLATKPLNLKASTDLRASLTDANYVIIATPTNYNEAAQSFDTSTVEHTISQITEFAPNACIIVKSTVPIGFVESARKKLKTNNLIFSPEFLREGRALYDNLYPSRIIVGEKSQRAAQFAALLSQGAMKADIDTLFTESSEAEAIKLFSNTYLAMRVSFFNELDSFAHSKKMNSGDIINGLSLDPRIGQHYNNPSFGYGGYCLPKDTRQLITNFNDIPQGLISAIPLSNTIRKEYIVSNVVMKRPKVVGIYRLVMKAGSDNFRESAVHDIINQIKEFGIKVIIHEPDFIEQLYSDCSIENELEHFKESCDVILANRMDLNLVDVASKVFTRDLYGVD